jgi:cytochrome c551
MRVSRGAIAAMVVAGLLGALAGCGDDDDNGAADTTTEAPATTAPPATTAAPTTTEEATTAATTEAEPSGDVAAGMTFFSQTCESCHLDGGNAGGGAGPQLAGAGLTEQQIRDQIVNGGGGMPPNLAQGQDLDNVTAYVFSLQ